MKINNFREIKSILFNNIGTKQTILKNIFWLFVSNGISQFLKLILIIYIARILGATEYGKFNFALAFISLFILFSDFGLSSIITRDFSRDKKREKEFLDILSLRILLSVGVLILILVSSFFITPDPLIRKVIWILAIVILTSTFSDGFCDFFRARQKMEYVAGVQILEALALIIAGFFVLLNFPSLVNLSYAYLTAAFISLILILFFFHLKIFPLKLSWQKVIWKKFLLMSWPIGLWLVFTSMYNYVDSTIMGHSGQITETGWYNAAYTIVNFINLPAAIISASFYPALSVALWGTKEKIQKIWDYQIEIIVFLAIPLVVGGIILAPKIIDFFYGQSFSPSIFAFQILIGMAGIVFLSGPFTQILVVSNQQMKICLIALFGVLFNLSLNLILIPKLSLYGASFAILITQLLVFLSLFYSVLKFTSIKPFNLRFFSIFFISVFSSILMYYSLSRSQIYNLHILFLVPFGAGIYFLTFFILKRLLSQFIKTNI